MEHVYYGPEALKRAATEISVNGLTPATFVEEAYKALIEALTSFLDTDVIQ